MDTPVSFTSANQKAWLNIDGAVIVWDDGVGPAQETNVLEEWVGGHYREWIIERLVDCPGEVEVRVDGAALSPTYGRWYWTPDGAAGLYRVEAEDRQTGQYYFGWVRVLPTTVSHAHFQRMIEEIQAIAYHLVFQATGGARESLALSREISQYSVGLVEYRKLEQLMGPLAQVLNTLRRDPRQILSVQKVRAPVGSTPIAHLEPPYDIERESSKFPREVTTFISTPSLDVFENQLVRHVIVERLPVKLGQIRTQLDSEIQQLETERIHALQRVDKAKPDKVGGWLRTANRYAEQISTLSNARSQVQRWHQQIKQWGKLSCVQGAGPLRQRPQPTPTLTREPRYRRFYQLYLALQRDLRLIDVSRFASMVSVRKQWQLYEIWSVMTLTQVCASILLEHGFTLHGNSGLFQLKRDTFEADLDRGYILSFRRGNNTVRIAYERLYESFKNAARAPDVLGSKTNTYLTPDLAIEAYVVGQTPRLLLLDAKYKHNHGVVVQEDIIKMQNYVHLIGLENPTGGKPLNADVHAVVVFPGTVPSLDPGADAGALPLEPGGPYEHVEAYSKLIEDWLIRTGVI